MSNFFKKSFFIKDSLLEGKHKKNNKIKYSTVKQFKTQTMQTKYSKRNVRRQSGAKLQKQNKKND